MTTGDLIKKRRIEIGMAGAALAKRVGVDRSTIWRIENNKQKNPFSWELFLLIADALGVYPDDLCGDEKEFPVPFQRDGMDELDMQIVDYLKKVTRDQKLMILAQLQVAIKAQEEKQ